MDNFVVSARKYRPSDFRSVVGQDHITITLKNAIKNNQLAQAFLFCGPRGVGKTTCSRILAKTINCEKISDEFEACDQCVSCVSFNDGRSLNIYELDAASNNSVDDIRGLIEQVHYAPQYGKYKVYIIDEVHMLSTAAFNAFLKTLEEPPAHAIFILATTEKHKILPTILSRCQIFDFKRIQIADITSHLQYIAKQENVNAEQDALHIISQKADGALRDALSLFDQLCTFTSNNLTYDLVIKNLNVLDYEYYFKVCDYFLKNEIHPSLLIFNEILNKGFDGHHFINGLAEHIRNLMVSQTPQTIELLEVGDAIKSKYLQQAKDYKTDYLLESLKIINQCDLDYRNAKNQRLLVELTLMKLAVLTQDIEKKKSKSIAAAVATPPPAAKEIVQKNPEVEILKAPIAIIATPTVLIQETVTEVIETSSQLEVSKNPISSSTISILEFLEIKETKQVEEAGEEQKPKNDKAFIEQEVLNTLKEYSEILKKEGKEVFASMLSNKPNIVGTNIEFTIPNRALEDEFNTERVNLLGFLKEKLKNDFIQITSFIRAIEDKHKLYTGRDKFERLVEINPHLLKMMDVFGLEIER